MPAQRAMLPDGRWHFQHGPIDIVIGADGEAPARTAALQSAWRRFETVLDELVAELPLLRQPLPATGAAECSLRGTVARRMWQACEPYRASFITPMAAVAGAVAQELIVCYERPGIERAWVNNGGDIALHLAVGASARIGLFANLARFDAAQARAPLPVDADFTLSAEMPVRGVATSGWRGRSFSLGIADSVTVLARSAAQADAAATVIANAVDIDDVRILRRPAHELRDDTDLGTLPVTVDVPALAPEQVRAALLRGRARALQLRSAGHVEAVLLACQGQFEAVGPLHAPAAPTPPHTSQLGSVFA